LFDILTVILESLHLIDCLPVSLVISICIRKGSERYLKKNRVKNKCGLSSKIYNRKI